MLVIIKVLLEFYLHMLTSLLRLYMFYTFVVIMDVNPLRHNEQKNRSNERCR